MGSLSAHEGHVKCIVQLEDNFMVSVDGRTLVNWHASLMRIVRRMDLPAATCDITALGNSKIAVLLTFDAGLMIFSNMHGNSLKEIHH